MIALQVLWKDLLPEWTVSFQPPLLTLWEQATGVHVQIPENGFKPLFLLQDHDSRTGATMEKVIVPFRVTTIDLIDFFTSSNLICKAHISDFQVHNLDWGLGSVFLAEFIELLSFKCKAKPWILLWRGPELVLDQQVKCLAKIHM